MEEVDELSECCYVVALSDCLHPELPAVATSRPTRAPVVVASPERNEASRDLQELRSYGYDARLGTSIAELLTLVRSAAPGTIVAALEFPEDPEMTFLEALRPAVQGGVRLIVTTTRPCVATAVRAMRAGADDYLVRPLPIGGLCQALGRPSVRVRRSGDSPSRGATPWDELSDREREVVETLYAGKSPRQIAALLSISHYTVRNHLRSIYGKLGVHSQRELLSLGRPQAPRSHRRGAAQWGSTE